MCAKKRVEKEEVVEQPKVVTDDEIELVDAEQSGVALEVAEDDEVDPVIANAVPDDDVRLTGFTLVEDVRPPKSCINCGQDWLVVKVYRDKEGDYRFFCQLCDHIWTPEHEEAPFRQRYTTRNPGQDAYAW